MSGSKGLNAARVGEADLVKMQQLLFIVTDGIVGVCIVCSEFDGCNVICQCSLLFIVKASQIHLHVNDVFVQLASTIQSCDKKRVL